MTAENEPRETDALDERWFVVGDEEWGALHERLREAPRVRPRLAELLECSSFGTDEARMLRASVGDERVARVVERMKELEAEGEGEGA